MRQFQVPGSKFHAQGSSGAVSAMTGFKSFEDIECWQLARRLASEIYIIFGHGKFAGDFVLRDQTHRASISVSSNIAEGFERDGNAEFLQFLSVAKGSVGEIRAQTYSRARSPIH